MSNNFILLVLLLSTQQLVIATTTLNEFVTKKATTFAVANVTRGSAVLSERSLDNVTTSILQNLQIRPGNRVGTTPANIRLSNSKYETAETNYKCHTSQYAMKHGLLSAVVSAFNYHLPLILSPDDFWLLIALSVGQFLGKNPQMAEKYRSTFVNHNGTKELTVELTPDDPTLEQALANKTIWKTFVSRVSEQIKNNTKTNISHIMNTPFSTSGDVEKTVMSITLMETMKNYFVYHLRLGCGIPEITLEGQLADYTSLVSRVRQLQKILPDFNWYLNRVNMHLNKIAQTKMGYNDRDYWKDMVTGHYMCGIYQVGWISDFFAYDAVGQPNNYSWQPDFADIDHYAVAEVPFVLDDYFYTGTSYNMKLHGGFMGLNQNQSTLAIRPVIGWIVSFDQQ